MKEDIKLWKFPYDWKGKREGEIEKVKEVLKEIHEEHPKFKEDDRDVNLEEVEFE
jgi:hypothetical protein